MQRVRPLRLFLAAFFMLAAILTITTDTPVSAAQSDSPSVIILREANGPVGPSMQTYIQRGLVEADDMDAEALIIMLDTPGGSVDTTNRIVQDIVSSDVPVIVFVGPRGALAGSAGLFVTLAGHGAAMAPDTAIGASSPILGTGQDIGGTAQEKIEEALAAQGRSLADRRGEEAQQFVDEAVFDARAISASEAVELGVVDFVAESPEEVIELFDGFPVEVNGREIELNLEDATVFTIEKNALQDFLDIILNPNVISLLMTLGTLMLIIEIRTPGGGILGVLGAAFLAVGLYGIGVLPTNWVGFIFLAIAVACLVLEVTTTTFGLFTAAGLASLIIGFVVLFSNPGVDAFGELSLPLLIGQALFIGALFVGLMYAVLKTRFAPPTTGQEGLIGKTGETADDLDPTGMVKVFGERWRAQSVDGSRITQGQQVQVVGIEGMVMYVQTLDRIPTQVEEQVVAELPLE